MLKPEIAALNQLGNLLIAGEQAISSHSTHYIVQQARSPSSTSMPQHCTAISPANHVRMILDRSATGKELSWSKELTWSKSSRLAGSRMQFQCGTTRTQSTRALPDSLVLKLALCLCFGSSPKSYNVCVSKSRVSLTELGSLLPRYSSQVLVTPSRRHAGILSKVASSRSPCQPPPPAARTGAGHQNNHIRTGSARSPGERQSGIHAVQAQL